MKLVPDKPAINIAGINLPCIGKNFNCDCEDSPSFIYEDGTSPYDNIQQLALAVSCNRSVLLQGPVGSGKTLTVEYLAHATGHCHLHGKEKNDPGFIKVQLGEQTDSRMLLGGYQSTEIPGQFVWKPGVLTKAVISGYWILLEDIDSSSSDVVTVVDNLVKNQFLSVPGYGDNIIPHPDFRMFATQRTLDSESNSVKSDILKHWYIIKLKPLNSSELISIINKKFPVLRTVASRMVSVFDLEYPVQGCDRIPSARDLLKWCNRCSKYFETGNFSVSLKVFQDAVDIFCGYMDRDCSISEEVGYQLGIVKNKANFLNDRYKPNISITEKKLIAGRSSLVRMKSEGVGLNRSKNMIFSLTAPSCRLIEKISCCLENNEPVLLVGETGCGKTTVLQYMAQILGRNLIVINMNQQSDTTDLIGGFKPVTFKRVMKPLCDKFETLFRDLFDAAKNKDCLNKFLILFNKQNWQVLLKFILYVRERALEHINKKLSRFSKAENDPGFLNWKTRLLEWDELGIMVQKFERQCELTEKSLVFSFIEGSLVKAVKRGDWVLLDEINLATSETLDCLSGLLEDTKGSLSLIEKGESQPVSRDSGFRLFAAMNPATDVGKKRLPIGLRNRFTEFYLEELKDPLDLFPLVETYLSELNQPPERVTKIVNFYLKVKKLSKSHLRDGNGKKPHYSLRNLCRALMVASKNLCGTTSRSLYEGLNLSFLTQLDKTSYCLVHEMVAHAATDLDVKALLNQTIPRFPGEECVSIEGFWITVGNLEPTIPDNYILSETVKRHLKDVSRIISLGFGIPILLEGDTSVGKTSLINYLAKCSGNFCARVNNHEHTDIQEYIGTYIADSNGKLVFKEGILCEAMRKGYWLILDELNLAPSEVLEALNRVLDDNRELYIPETQTTIKAHKKFMLFATQNPPGLYGGRKELSRAFKNRFVELQFSQIPSDELVTILQKRCQMPLTYCKKMVAVMEDLQLRRRGSEIFVGKSGFITLRDLFRWGERYQKASVTAQFYDWDQHMANEGYILLAGRVRLQEEAKIIEDVISKHFKRKPCSHNLFSLHENTSEVSKNILESILAFSKDNTEFKHVVWTYSMRRLAVLVCKAIEFSEPVLLVGETGCGKTTIVQMLALMRQKKLYSVSCHTHSESGDFLGGLRPVREESRVEGKLFEWCDGPLVQAMMTGSFFLADEISLADDSVLERLNSLLEPERTILLTEKGGDLIKSDSGSHATVADEDFQFVGTMNPGGDFGKKELSPALRNRFTEIWIEVNDNKRDDYLEIIKFNLKEPSEPLKSKASELMVDFVEWFQKTEYGRRLVISVRDMLTWVNFMNVSELEWTESCVHGCCLTFLDGIGCGVAFSNSEIVNKFRTKCVLFLEKRINEVIGVNVGILRKCFGSGEFIVTDMKVGIHPFYISRGNTVAVKEPFVFNAPTTFSNALRLLRGLQMSKAILLEGSPGVGKTSLVSSLAKASGHKLTRINLSDQTDISDLFGADLPEEDAPAGHFVWRDGPFLTALKEGHWILLDELNLALQSVLEGLNAVLDHRGSAFIPELNKTFYISKDTKIFACQNPMKEGGNRRGLPKSFLNRFTQVCVEPLSVIDYTQILRELFPSLSSAKIKDRFVIDSMVEFNCQLCNMIRDGKVGSFGGPWEFNLRDITRWAQGVIVDLDTNDYGKFVTRSVSVQVDDILKISTFKYANLLYFVRFRSNRDRECAVRIFESVFGYTCSMDIVPRVYVTRDFFVIGGSVMPRNNSYFFGELNEFGMFFESGNDRESLEITRLCRLYRGKRNVGNLRLLERQQDLLSFLSLCVKMNWVAILVGDHGTGKTNCVRTMAAVAGRRLRVLTCNSAMDTTEILGGFEQVDYNRQLDNIAEAAKMIVLSSALRDSGRGRTDRCLRRVSDWLTFSELTVVDASSMSTNALSAFQTRLQFLEQMLQHELNIEDCDLREMASSLVKELDSLRNRLTLEEKLSSGGKFEWVDSVLVKCLKDGSWLLMENVNLCSSAVLDRLNCLLEPNGLLTIGERGARADGSLVTIKPHPDFRLFFTMNPKNGVISRAMRNRGVEIYLMPDGEWHRQDKLALLTEGGIAEVATQLALMEFDSKMNSPSILNLVENAFWTAQYIEHGFGKSEAFAKSTQQVYRISSDDHRKAAIDLSLGLDSDKLFRSISWSRPPLNNYFVDPDETRLKQSCALLSFLCEVEKNEAGPKVPKSDLLYFLASEADLNLSDGMKFSILYIYLTINRGSILSLKNVIRSLLSGTGRQTLLQLTETLSNALLETERSSSDLPWDLRWYENLKMFSDCDDEKNKTVMLMVYLFLLGEELWNGLDNLKESMKTQAFLTVAQYSMAVDKGFVEDCLSNHSGVTEYCALLRRFDDLVVEYLKSAETTMNLIQFLESIQWRFRFGKLGNLTLFTGAKRKDVNEDAIVLIGMHFYWFNKFVAEQMKGLNLPDAISEKYSSFVQVLQRIQRSEDATHLVKISNRFRRELGHPPPDRYLPDAKPEVEEAEEGFRGDSFAKKKILNQFVQYFHTCYTCRKLDQMTGDFHRLLRLADDPLRSKIEGCDSEVMFHCLRSINSDYEFCDDLDDNAEKIYSRQVLLFHRPAWTCRIVQLLFGGPEMWNLDNYQKTGAELMNVMSTILPQTSLPAEMDPRTNEWTKLSAELSRVHECLKRSLEIDSGDLRTFLTLKVHSSTPEKPFYERVLQTVNGLSELKLTPDSGFEVFGCFWVLLGLLELLILRSGKVDPIRKKLIKFEYAKFEAIETEAQLETFRLNSLIKGTGADHPYIQFLEKRLKTQKEFAQKCERLDGIERDPQKFLKLCSEVEFFMETFDEILRFCENIPREVFSSDESSMLMGYFFRKGRYIGNKNRRFIAVLERDFITFFSDLTYPLLAASSQIEHGMNLIMSELLRKPYSKLIPSSLRDLCAFPIPVEREYRHPFRFLNSVPWHPPAAKSLNADKVLLLFGSCSVKRNEWLTFMTEAKYDELMTMFSKVVEYWKTEEETRLEKEREKESLYLQRGVNKCTTLSEEEELKEEQMRLFPTFDADFEEVPRENGEPVEVIDVLSTEQLSQIAELHMKIVREGAEFVWIVDEGKKLSPDFLAPLRMRYLLLSHLLPHISFLMEYDADMWLLPGLLPLIRSKECGSLPTEATLLEDDRKIYDFYKDKNVSEANKCLEILNGLSKRSAELLAQWPEHPVLVQMNVIIERIMSFSIESPLMRFLTGLELLLQSCQNWESVAHSGVSICDHLVSLTNLIIEWRKLELQGWRNCLQTARLRMRTAACKWWFHFWCMIEEYLSGDQSKEATQSLSDLLQALYSFIETSPVGEFEIRLEILLSFHLHVVRLTPSAKRDELAIAFWNLYTFYEQYRGEVEKKVDNLTASVVKKLKDYVSIAKYNAITYWSVKQAVDKSHRSLLKYVREYEAILKQPVELKAMDPNTVASDGKKNHVIQDINQFLKPLNVDGESTNTSSVSCKKLEKASKYSKDIILIAEYPNLILRLEELAEEICEGSQHFGNLDVDRTIEKDRQKSQAKSIVHQKRRALADLFKTLQTIGLSYRTGLSISKFGVLQLCEAPPMIASKTKNTKKLSGEDYYLKSVSRRFMLENLLLTPSKEIGPQIIERLRGYASHIMDLNKKQKLNLCRAEYDLRNLRRYETMLTDLNSSSEAVIPDQEKMRRKFVLLKESVDETYYVLQQFRLILEAWPSDGDKLKTMNFMGKLTPEILIASNREEAYLTAQHNLRRICDKIKTVKESCERNLGSEMVFDVKFFGDDVQLNNIDMRAFSIGHVDRFNALIADFKAVISDIREFRLIFGENNCLVDSLKGLETVWASCEDMEILKTDFDDSIKDVDVVQIVETILLSIQKLLKKYKSVDDVVNETEDEPELLDGHLSKSLVESLESDLESLNMHSVNRIMASIIRQLTTSMDGGKFFLRQENNIRNLRSAIPLIQQYSVLCSYFVEQQRISYRTSNKLSSILIGVFNQVAQKGFCIPPEYEEDGEGWGNEGGKGGFGLGDGIGEKDVSDRIESEDQLEGCEPKGQEKDKEDRDCKEEEKGVEMSEDFDGKAQDIGEKGDEEEDSGKEEDEDPDVKEMGETEEGAEKLDKELWSSDSENEDGEEEVDKKEETGQGKGKEITEDNYAGKEDEGNEQKENEPEDRRKKQKETIDDINEQEDVSDQIDPYHGHQEPEPEPEPMDLPDNLNLDGGEEGDKQEDQNPFDIDSMKEPQPPKEAEEEEVDKKTEEKKEDEETGSSDDEGENEEAIEAKPQDELMDVDQGDKDENVEGLEIEKESAKDKDEEEKEEENELPQKEFEPSDDRPSTQPVQPAPESEKDELASKDQVVGSSSQPEFQTQAQEVTEKPKDENKGTGQAEVENMKEGHEVGASNKEKLQPGEFANQEEKQKRKRPGKTDENRCLGADDEVVKKRLKTLDKVEEEAKNEDGEDGAEESELYQHIKENVEKASQVVDAATKEQAESQAVPNKEDEQAEKPKEEEEVFMDVDEEIETKEIDELKPSDGRNKEGKMKQQQQPGEEDVENEEMPQQIDGDIVATLTVERGPETTFHTNPLDSTEERVSLRDPAEVQALRLEIQEQLSAINQSQVPSQESSRAWQLLNSAVDELSRDLSEQLRLILEPTKATRLKGDYRTGRRINMRRIISYIASEFRKDNIWLRRTKPWKRDHEIVLAIDDSSSMADNNSKELAFESLALVAKALGFLEAGELGILSFGERTKVVHRLGEPFTDETGARLLQEFTFDQNKTLISNMLDVSASMMTSDRRKGEVSRLLMIISDGRGVFSEGLDSVRLAVRRATDEGIFLVFVIIDDPKSKDSIMDIRMPEFRSGKFLGIKSYMEQFPFPYYLILRDITALPTTLSDALRQWFELITSTNGN